MSVTIKDLLEAGVHFGHQTRRWNPKMKKFIFTARSGIYIIDLQKTLQCLQAACQKAKEVTSKRLPILFVGTKKQAKQVIREEAGRCEAFYVSERWLGGMLTNYHTIKNSIKRVKDLEKMKEDGTFSKLPKKEVLQLEKEITKLNKMLGGIKEMGRLPGLLYVVDSKKEKIAVAEANKLKIPVVAVIDTNSDPDVIDFPIAGNDDSVKSIKVITSEMCNCILEEKKKLVEVELKEEVQKEKFKKSGKEGD